MKFYLSKDPFVVVLMRFIPFEDTIPIRWPYFKRAEEKIAVACVPGCGAGGTELLFL
jgi:hypothetical protein